MAGEDPRYEALDVPAVLHELNCEPVEQVGVAGEFPLRPEVGTGPDQADAKELLPETIDCNARGERMFSVDQPVREVQTVIVAILGPGWKRWEEGRNVTADLLPGVIVLPAFHNEAFPLLGQVSHDKGDCRFLFDGFLLTCQPGHFFPKGFEHGAGPGIDLSEPLSRQDLAALQTELDTHALLVIP